MSRPTGRRYRDMLALAEIHQKREALLREASALGLDVHSNNFHKAAQAVTVCIEDSWLSWEALESLVARAKLAKAARTVET